jgi:hypothetical protein
LATFRDRTGNESTNTDANLPPSGPITWLRRRRDDAALYGRPGSPGEGAGIGDRILSRARGMFRRPR